jgi:hypothetical protein
MIRSTIDAAVNASQTSRLMGSLLRKRRKPPIPDFVED